MSWISPTSHDDTENKWNTETNAYDGDKDTRASGPNTWLELILGSSISCDKVRACKDVYYYEELIVDVYYSGEWHQIFDGSLTEDNEWNEMPIGATVTTDRARIKGNHGTSTVAVSEFEFNEAVVAHEWEGSDGIAIGEALVKNPIKVLSDGIAFSDALIKNPIKTFTDAIAFTDVVEKVYTHIRTFTDSFAFTDTLVKSMSKVLSDGIAFTDTLKKLWVHGVLRILNAIRNLPSVREEGKKR